MWAIGQCWSDTRRHSEITITGPVHLVVCFTIQRSLVGLLFTFTDGKMTQMGWYGCSVKYLAHGVRLLIPLLTGYNVEIQNLNLIAVHSQHYAT